MGNHNLKNYPPAFYSTLLGVLVGPWVLRVAEIMFCVLAADILLMVDASLLIRTLLIFPFYVFAVSALHNLLTLYPLCMTIGGRWKGEAELPFVVMCKIATPYPKYYLYKLLPIEDKPVTLVHLPQHRNWRTRHVELPEITEDQYATWVRNTPRIERRELLNEVGFYHYHYAGVGAKNGGDSRYRRKYEEAKQALIESIREAGE